MTPRYGSKPHSKVGCRPLKLVYLGKVALEQRRDNCREEWIQHKYSLRYIVRFEVTTII